MLLEKEIRFFESLIQQEMTDLLGREIVFDVPTLDGYEQYADVLDQAIVNHDHHVALVIHQRNNEKLERLLSALERIRKGTYGICEDCDEMISKERLRVTPLATLCIDCKRREETFHTKKSLWS